jgi:hypothetical protein
MGRQEVAQHRVRVTRVVAAWDLRPAIRAGPAMASRAGWLGLGEEGAGGSVAQHHARFLSAACAANFVRGGVTIGRSVPRRLVVTPGLEPGPSRLYGEVSFAKSPSGRYRDYPIRLVVPSRLDVDSKPHETIGTVTYPAR